MKNLADRLVEIIEAHPHSTARKICTFVDDDPGEVLWVLRQLERSRQLIHIAPHGYVACR